MITRKSTHFVRPHYLFLFVSLIYAFSAGAQVSTAQKELNETVQKADEAASASVNFIENKGQWPANVLYRADVPGGQMLATPQGMLVGKYDIASLAAISKYEAQLEEIQKGLNPNMNKAKLGPAPQLKGHGWKFNFVGGSLANAQTIKRSGESQDYYNYLIGDVSTHATNVHSYTELVYKNVYQGVDVRYYTAPGGDLENDIIVSPGADAAQLKLQIDGIGELKMNKDGDLILQTSVGDVTVPSPVSYLKDAQGHTTKINVSYVLAGGNQITFRIPDYDHTKTLVIDPIVMRWATWVSANSSEGAHNHGIDVDASGNIYTTGRYGSGLITTGAFQTTYGGSTDVFIGKYTEPVTPGGAGVRVWQTYMGTSGSDISYAVNVGPDGNIYIVGYTGGNFAKTLGTGAPTANWTTQRTVAGNITQQSWIAKVNSAGTWALVREIGPATNDFTPTPWDVRVVPTGASTFDMVVVGSVTQNAAGADGDITAAITPGGTAKTGTGDLNGFVYRISSDLSSISWSRQFTSTGNNDDQFNIASVDASGNIYIAGYTTGSGGISYNNPSGQTGLVGTEDGWLMKLTGSTGNAAWSRYFNASSGNTLSILCMEFNRAKTNLILGGLTSGAATYNITTAATYGGGGADYFIASVPATGGATNWGTYYGGNQQEYNMMGLNVDQNDDIYVLGYTYSKNITTVDHPVETSAYNNNTNNRQAIFFKLSGSTPGSVLYCTFLGGSGDDYDPVGERGIKFSNCRIYLCLTAVSNDFPLTAGTLTSTKTSANGTILEPLLISMSNPPDLQGNAITGGTPQTITCGQTPQAITANVPTYIIPTIIRNNTNQTNGTTGAYPNGVPVISTYQWQQSIDSGYTWTNIAGATGQNYTPSNLTTTGIIKFRRIINGDACNRAGDTLAVVNITVNPTSPAPVVSNNSPLCAGQTLTLTANTVAGATYSWTGPNGFTSTQQNPTITNVTAAAAGVYSCTTTTTSNGCPSYASTTTVSITTQPAAPTLSSNSPLCSGKTLNLTASGLTGATFSWTGPNGFTSTSATPSITNVSSLNAGTYFATQTLGSCGSTAASIAVRIDTISTPTAVSATPSPLCSGQTLTLSATGLNGATLNWTFPDGGTATGSPVVRNNVTTVMAGTYSVTQTLGGCTSSAATASVTINATPAAPTASASPVAVCAGSSLTLSATGAAGATFSWSYPDGGTATGTPVVRNNVTAAMGGTYSVTQTVNGCTSTSAGTVAVTVNPTPVVTAAGTASKFCSGGSLSLTSSVSSGTSPFTYVWSGPDTFSSTQANPTRGNTVPAMTGTYNLTVTDSKGCSASASTPFIRVNQSPTVSASANNTAFCTGGSINLSATPSAGSTYTYSWTGPNGFTSTQQNPTVSSITTAAAGVYTVQVTDTNGCTATGSTASLVVNTSPLLSVSSLTPTYCSGSTISLTSTVTGGTPAFGYSWSGPNSFISTQANPTISNASTANGGVYTLTVTDNNSCKATASTSSITVFLSPTITASSTANAYCAGTTITLNSTAASGTSPYSYLWSGPASFVSHTKDTTRGAITTTMSGVYTIVVTDNNGCTATASTGNITVNPGFTVNASSNSPVCAGGTLNLTSSSTGGTAPFTYSWSATSFTSALQNPTRTGANAAMSGTYTVSITDNNGCSSVGTTNVVVNPATTINVSANTPLCAGDTLKLLAAPASGTAPFTYTWSGPVSFTAAIANPTRINSSVTYSGTYTVTAIDNNGCSGTGSVNVTVNPLPAVTASSTAAGYCVGTAIQLSATPSLGTAPYVTYNWSGPPSYSSNQQNPSISPVTSNMAGSYTVTVTDSKGCSAKNSVSVAVYSLPVVSAGAGQTSCSGANVTLGGSPTASGGLAPYSYAWSNGAGINANPSVAPTATTTYTVTVTDNRSCSGSASASVTVNSNPTANAGLDKTIPSCSLVGTTLGGSPAASGGTGPYTYKWSPATGLSSADSSNPSVVGIGTTTYTLMVTDANGCSAADAAVITVNTTTLSAHITAGSSTAWCASGISSVVLTANVTGGTGAYTYSWTGSNLSSTNTLSTTANPNVAGTYTYTVLVTDATGCSKTDSTTITVYPKPTANAGLANYYICRGDSVRIGGNTTASGGTSPYTYGWSNGAASIANPTVAPLSTATYTVTVTDAHTCTATTSTVVNVRSLPTVNAGPDLTQPSCSPTGIQIGGSPTASGTVSPYTYVWSPTTGIAVSNIANPTVQGITSDVTYTVVVRDSNGCFASDQVIVHANNTPLAVSIIASGSTTWCEASGGSTILSANVTGGTGALTYAWSGTSISPTNAPNATVNPNTANIYTYNLTVTDAFNCTAAATKSVTVNPIPSASAGAASYTICSGAGVAIGGSPTATGGTAPYTYSWSNGAGTASNPTVSPTTGLTYAVTVTDNRSCTATASTSVNVNPSPSANAGVDQTIPSCSLVGTTLGGSPTATGGTAPYIYKWAPAAGLSSADSSNPVVQGIGSTTPYTVTVTDANGCTASDVAVITVTGSTLAVNITAGSSTAWCAGGSSSTVLTANVTGGAGSYTYSWTGNSISTNNTVSTTANPGVAGTYVYSVIATDLTGCQVGDTISIKVYPTPTADAGLANYYICRGDSVRIGGSPAANGGTGPYFYSWSNGAASISNPTVSPLSNATYTLTVTDAHSCVATASTAVNVRSNPTANAGADVTQPSCSPTGIQIGGSPSATGGVGPYSYAWSPSAGLSSASNANPIVQGITADQTYTLVVTDSNGCSATDQVIVHANNTPLAVSIVTGSTSWCAGSGSSTILASNVSGGTGTLSYVWSGTSITPTNAANATVNPSTANTYTYNLTVTDAFNCTASANKTITVYATPSASAGSPTYTICNGSSVTIGGSPTATGGNGVYTYSWSNGASAVSNPSVSPVNNTTYAVTVTDGHNCTAGASTSVVVHSNPAANAGLDKTIASCSLVGTTLGGSPTASGGAGPYTYKWSPVTGLSSADSSNPTVLGIGTTATYTVTVTDANGCSASDAAVITVNPTTLTAHITAGSSTSWCASGTSSVVLTANVTGGTGAYTYSWTGSNLSSSNAVSTTANPSVAGTYTYVLQVTDATGCSKSDTATITVYPKPTANAGAANYFICRGDSVRIGDSPTASGGTSPFSYAWSNGAASVANPTVAPVSTATYTVTVTDAHTCTATASTSVNVRSLPTANAGPDVTQPSCSPTGIQIGGSPTASGTVSPYTYVWSPSAGLTSSTIANPNVQGITADQTYTVVVKDSNGCSASDQVIVHANNTPLTVGIFAGGSTSWCAGSNSSVFLAANVTGGNGAITYAWSGTSISPTNAPTATVNPNTANSYTYNVTVTDAFNCTAAASKVITVNALPTANPGSPSYTICNGDSVKIGGNPTAAGGNGTYTYAWTNGAASVANPSVSPVSNTTYTVIVTDGNSCTATATTSVTVRTNPTANAGPDKTMPSCTPNGLTIGGSPTASGGGGAPYTYLWSPSAGLSSSTAANPTVTGLNADTTYTVVVTDVNGCHASDQMVMHITHNTPSINITSSGSTSWCAGTNSSVNLTANVAGGTSPLAYSWSGVDILPVNSQVATVYPNSAGQFTYNVTVTDGFNCTATASKLIKVNVIPTVSAGALVHNICPGASITIGGSPTAAGGILPYTYAWNSGANPVANPNVSPLNSTTYIVTVTDSAGCSATSSTTVLVRPQIVANAGADKSIASCTNACTVIGGSPSGSGGSGTLTYAWSPSTGLSSTTVANPTACGLSGNALYTLTVTDTAGCTATDQVAITVTPSSLTAEAGTGGSLCLNSGDSVMLGGYPTAVGGTPAYTYTWSPTNGLNLVNPANPVAYPSVTTMYHLTVTDAQGCTSIDSAQVRVFQSVTAHAGNDTTVCEGSPANLGGHPTGTGGTGGYTYVWTPTTNVTGITQSNPTATPFTTTDYKVVVTDSNGCHASDHLTVFVRSKPVAQAGLDKNITACVLDSVVIGESPSAVSGTPPYIFSWTPATGLSSTSAANPIVTAINTTQTYVLTVTDSLGCKGSDNVVVTVVPSTLQAYQPTSLSICGGPNSCVQLGGLPTAIGGVSPYTYAWSGTLQNPASSNPIACPSGNATYGLTITDSKGCSVTATQSVAVKPAPTVNAGRDTAVCQGQAVTLGGRPTASGGSGRGFTYSWTPTSGISSAVTANPVATASVTTTYTVVVADSNGCSASDDILVTVRPLPAANAGADKNISICSRDSVFIGGLPVATGGTAPYTYQWTPATGLSSTAVPNPIVTGITQTASYNVVVTDTFGCKATDNVVVNVTQQTLQAQAGSVNVICASSGTPVTIGGLPSAVGGTGPYTYNWSPAAGLNNATIANPIATVTATITYHLTVTDAKGCVAVDSVKITQSPAPIVNAGADTALCLGFGKTLGGAPTASGGTGSYHYSWTPTTGLNANNTSNPSAFPLVTTTYQVVVTDSNGCQAADAVTIVINQNPTANAGADVTLTTCLADSAKLGGSPSASGGAGSYTYTWSPTAGLSSSTSANPTATGISSSSLYGLTVTDANGCSASDAVFISVVRSTLAADAGNNVSICAGTNTIVTLGGSPTPTGGTAPYSYNWSPSSSLNSTSVSNPFATPTVTTGYSVTVTDAKGCTATDSVTITVNAAPTVNAGRDTTVCGGSPVLAGGSPTATGGTAPYTYSWSPTVGVSNSAASNPQINATLTTTYTVMAVDAHGCTASDMMNIAVHQNPTADAGPDKTLVACNADSVFIGGSPSASGGQSPYTYSWSPPASVSSASIANPYVSHLGSTSTFTLVVTDQYGCSASDQMLVTVNNSTLFADAGNDVTICKGSSGLVILGGIPTATGGTPSYTYTWSPAAGLSSTTVSNPAALPSQTTLYTVVVKDAAGCIATDTVRFVVNPKPVVDAGVSDTVCQGVCAVIGGAPTADGTPSLNTYAWSPSTGLNDPAVANPTACPSTTTRYTVSVTNEFGCTNTASVNVKVNPRPIANAGQDVNIVACPNACVSIGGSPTASGGTGPYSYSWAPALSLDSTNVANPLLCNPREGIRSYTVTVTDGAGCTASDVMFVVPVPSDLTADAGPDKSICAGQNTCISLGGTPTAIGGVTPYTIRWSPNNFCSSGTIANPQVNPTITTTYNMIVIDALGCVSRDTVTVFANPAVTAVVRPDTSVCAGASAVLGGYPATGSGGTAPFTYAWSPTIGLLNPSSANPTVNTIVTTTYCVTVTDSVGCSSSACQAVNINTPLVVDAGPDKTISGCPNASVVLGGYPPVRGGSGNYSYSWTPATGLDSAQTAHPHVMSLSTATVYTLVVTDRVTGCSSSDQVLVSVSPSTLTVNAGANKTLCYNDHNGIQIGGIPSASGGVGPYTYKWTPSAGLSDSSGANPIALPSATTVYTLSVTDALGCAFTDTMVVTIVPRVAVSIVGLNSKYCVNAGNVTLVGSPSGGTFSGPGVAGNTFEPSQIGVGTWCIRYTRTAPETGCVSDTVVCVTVDSLPVLKVTGYSSSYCHFDSAVTLVGAPAGGTFSGAGIAGNMFYPANATVGNNIITYTYTDTLFGCSNSTQFTINVKSVPSLTVSASDSMVCPGAPVSLSDQYSTDVFNIAWSDATGNTIYSGLNAFTVNPTVPNHCYVATAVNTPGCVVKDSVCIGMLDCNINAVNEACDADSVIMNDTIRIRVLANDTLPLTGTDTIITIRTAPLKGTAVVNADHTISYITENEFSGSVEFSYQVCVVVKGFAVCDTADVCVTVVDTTVKCHFPNTITPNNDGVNDGFVISCNDEYPLGELRIYDRWGAEVYRSDGHYNNDWSGHNQQGTVLPDGTYFYVYYFNNGTNKIKKGFVDVYR